MDNIVIALLVAAIIITICLVAVKSPAAESYTRIFRGVGGFDLGGQEQVIAPTIVTSGVIPDMTHSYYDGRYEESCDMCPSADICGAQCPQFQDTEMELMRRQAIDEMAAAKTDRKTAEKFTDENTYLRLNFRRKDRIAGRTISGEAYTNAGYSSSGSDNGFSDTPMDSGLPNVGSAPDNNTMPTMNNEFAGLTLVPRLNIGQQFKYYDKEENKIYRDTLVDDQSLRGAVLNPPGSCRCQRSLNGCRCSQSPGDVEIFKILYGEVLGIMPPLTPDDYKVDCSTYEAAF
ncbi:hypothetical protein F-S17_0355 [Faustovirus]|nr:hypothetical protein F-LCD7_0359 [Faustovirus]QJX72127.1 hypothetical protein F-M6_0364 [Faustovirus]QJX72621.1 hypothetical protein F-S17_0355 [Faustovirus]QJX73118.1 hypothetical protein F-VV57_0357 [Faustovirus]QJX73625.1 hypothetical protein F-VV63_0359 [Faustovirus]